MKDTWGKLEKGKMNQQDRERKGKDRFYWRNQG